MREFALPIHGFVRWHKLVGGRWWGYTDEIGPGEYSDDTQLALAVARCIASSGNFEPEQFAYCELPLWLHYERGGGKSMKAAARSLVQRKVDWLHNFYKQGEVDYRESGANGAAMRTLPIALASIKDEERFVRDSFFNAVITHGHPRAILGAILFGYAVRFVLTHSDPKAELLAFLRESMGTIGHLLASDQRVRSWIEAWEKRGKVSHGSFRSLVTNTKSEVQEYLDAIPRHMEKPPEEYYRFVGALNPETKGSAVATVCAAISLFLRFDMPEECLYAAANLIGSDTDTVSLFLGSLLGARHGIEAVPTHLLSSIQDREYLLKVAKRLHGIAAGEATGQATTLEELERQDAYLRILAWEIGLHEMFWDAIDVGGVVFHPTLGKGNITKKEVRSIPRDGYVAKLIHIVFECGQSCMFHSRVKDGDKVSESLGEDVAKALGM